MHEAAFVLWLLLLAGAVFYVRRARHPDSKPIAAYLIFVTVFSVAAFALFTVFAALLEWAGEAALLANPLGAAAFLVAVFLPAFLIGRWQLRRPPLRSPRP
jgi:hypothetical protein